MLKKRLPVTAMAVLACCCATWLFAAQNADMPYTVVFEGYPAKKVLTGDVLSESPMSREQSNEFSVQIVVDREGSYFWMSREMKPLVRIESGAYVTYISESGYVRTYTDAVLPLLRGENLPGIDTTYEYVEHIPHLLSSINYYGKRRDR